MKRHRREAVVFFDGGAGNCPAALRAVHLVVIGRVVEAICQVHLIGHAGGGRDALRFALTHPERTRSLILSETGAGLRHSSAVLAGIKAPVLVVAGGDAFACPPPAARKLAARFSSGRVAEIVEAARSPYAETPEEWCEVVLQFLRSVARQKAQGHENPA